MTPIAEELKTQLAQLSEQERAELTQFLIGSLDERSDPDAEFVWDEELARRAEQIIKGTEPGIPADQVFCRLRKRYSRSPSNHTSLI